MRRRGREAQDVRERAVRMVREHRGEYPSEWAAITSIACTLGMGTEALRPWPRRAEIDRRRRPGVTTAERERIREPGREDREERELRRADEIPKAAAACFAREFDPRVPMS
jgi:transposase